MAEYTTITPGSEATARLLEKRSTFIALARNVGSEEEARDFFAAVASRHHDARHVCWAFRLRSGRALSSDNGEPSGTAGRPILSQIEALGLMDVAVAVVRWFGGVKLGPSGLIAAYRGVTREALEGAPTELVVEKGRLAVTVPWHAIEPVERMARRPGVDITARTPGADGCRVELTAPLTDLDALEQALRAALLLTAPAAAVERL